ncbi:MAG: hypothetical protein ACRC62_08495 [Microcoleus sp.]
MEELLTQILDELRSQSTRSQSKAMMGFSDPPKVRYVYANRQYPDCLWYFWDGEKKVHEPIEHHALTGIVEKIEIEEKEFRGKPDRKVNIRVRADRTYVIQSGTETMFAKGLIYTLSKLPAEAFAQPIMIAVESGDTDQVLFCRVYNPATGKLVFAPYGDDVDWKTVFGKAIGKVDQAHSV